MFYYVYDRTYILVVMNYRFRGKNGWMQVHF